MKQVRCSHAYDQGARGIHSGLRLWINNGTRPWPNSLLANTNRLGECLLWLSVADGADLIFLGRSSAMPFTARRTMLDWRRTKNTRALLILAADIWSWRGEKQ